MKPTVPKVVGRSMASSTPVDDAGRKKRLATTFNAEVDVPSGMEVTLGGMSATIQCQHPPLGASGSKQVNKKLLVVGGNPDHDNWGEILPPSAVWAMGSVSPCRMVSLVRVNDGTGGKTVYGSGATGRFMSMAILRSYCARGHVHNEGLGQNSLMSKKQTSGTPAILALDAAGVDYSLHEYEHDPRTDLGFGLEGAAKLGIEPERIFKTLMAHVDGKLACGIVPVSGKLSLKALAAACGGKKAEMTQPAQAERATGYVVGGISPLGQKTAHPTVIDSSAQNFGTILVSGGRRGLDIELRPSDLQALTNAVFAPIGRPD